MSHQASDIITPKALLLDERLTPLERNAWLTFRALASSDGTVVLSYDALRKYLPSAPGSKRAALETVSRAVLCLRLSTWIALVEYRRNPMTGFSMASRYAVRNQPLAFDDACMEDEDYLPLLERALGHANTTIRQLAQSILDEAMRHPDRLEKLPATLQARIRGLHRGDDHDPGSPGGSTARDAPMPEASDGIPKPVPASATTVRTVEKEVLKEVRTYRSPTEVQVSMPDVPARFRQLPQDQQRVLAARLRGLPPEQRLAVLAEWDMRCESGGVHNAIAYLYGLIKKAVEGVFKLWAARKSTPQQTPMQAINNSQHGSPPAPSPSSSSQAARPASREVAQRHLDQIRRMLKTPSLPIGQIIGCMADSGMLPTAPGNTPAAARLEPLGSA
ncbi:STY4528 family pathogenicity island replication protein [Xanthomonas citri pv. anacardii]|uniref:STY4528 family pathogenicity island replication protein n=1 Tax=Xanthomonas citri TaxID=346 RepID=UPI000CCC35E8|nr:STY4528 family pathogenicity island replication protein [Xanthomonas citri]MCT8357463.1 STY4528 family pathogenicity island replication protein [Xanthomonas citri pv. anacardii]MCT8361543.1 STY4528 family pathogenicity island replication protein [Xanthomonas citri pv. anacardii]MCT8365328.1 STY4528 family pathogenicity island replication protein [Xanthomonas citri pv. anacardii]MCT8369487.1 STY4528 family pathogenicity island replication protein [Xanthomonas citri pv. anacardii]MCT8373523.1